MMARALLQIKSAYTCKFIHMDLSLACVRSLASFPLLLALATDIEQAVSHIISIPMHTLILGVPTYIYLHARPSHSRTRARMFSRFPSLAYFLPLSLLLSLCLSVSLSLCLSISQYERNGTWSCFFSFSLPFLLSYVPCRSLKKVIDQAASHIILPDSFVGYESSVCCFCRVWLGWIIHICAKTDSYA